MLSFERILDRLGASGERFSLILRVLGGELLSVCIFKLNTDIVLKYQYYFYYTYSLQYMPLVYEYMIIVLILTRTVFKQTISFFVGSHPNVKPTQVNLVHFYYKQLSSLYSILVY